jgi:hypothetical protein
MYARYKMHDFFSNYKGYFIIGPITLILLLILTVSNSCDEILDHNKKQSKADGYVKDIISHEAIDNAKVNVLEWYESMINPGVFLSTTIDSGYTDTYGHFLINYNSNDKYSYSLSVHKDGYFDDGSLMGSITSLSNININMFPHGFIKTHITNKIDSARWIDIYFTSFYYSVDIWRDGFINTQLFNRAFTDTSLITTTIGGVTNNLKIFINCTDYIPDARVVKDTSFLTLRHDTVHLNIILY